MATGSLRRLACAAALAALTLTGCDTFDSLDFLNTKPKLPGVRKPVFPEGVPGVTQGIPPELQKGYSEQAAQPGPDPATAAVQQLADEKEKPKPKPVARPKPPPQPRKPPPAQAQAPRPEPPQQQQQQAQPQQPQPQQAQPQGQGGNQGLLPWPGTAQQQPTAPWPTTR